MHTFIMQSLGWTAVSLLAIQILRWHRQSSGEPKSDRQFGFGIIDQGADAVLTVFEYHPDLFDQPQQVRMFYLKSGIAGSIAYWNQVSTFRMLAGAIFASDVDCPEQAITQIYNQVIRYSWIVNQQESKPLLRINIQQCRGCKHFCGGEDGGQPYICHHFPRGAEALCQKFESTLAQPHPSKN